MSNWRSIAAEVCEARRVPLKEVFSPSRYAPVVAARHQIMWRLIDETEFSHENIGDIMGRTRQAVWHGVAMHSARIGRWPSIRIKPIWSNEAFNGELKLERKGKAKPKIRLQRPKPVAFPAYRPKSRDWVVYE